MQGNSAEDYPQISPVGFLVEQDESSLTSVLSLGEEEADFRQAPDLKVGRVP